MFFFTLASAINRTCVINTVCRACLIAPSAIVAWFARTTTVIYVTYSFLTPCTTRIVARWSPVPRRARGTTAAVRTCLTAGVGTQKTILARRVVAIYAARTLT